MGKRTLWTGIIMGATIGGLVSLLNEDTRKYVKETASNAKENVAYYTSNPTEAVSQLKSTVENVTDTISNNTGSALNALDQVEHSLHKFLKK